jgi:DNA-binding NtrC family response regulator
VDVRVITATNRDLETAVAEGQFREDLYFRLNVVSINLPPLRDRREEIPFLTDHFLKKYSVQYNKPYTPVTPDLARKFVEYDWPGNVRQLENMIKRMVVLGGEAAIVTELQQPGTHFTTRPAVVTPAVPRGASAPPPVPAVDVASFVAPPPREPVYTHAEPGGVGIPAPAAAAGSSVSLKDISRTAAREAERELILRMLTRTRWNRKEAAEILGISYKALLYKIKENGLDKAS